MLDTHNLFSFEHRSRSLHQINTAPYESYRREQRCLQQEFREQPWAYLGESGRRQSVARLRGEKQGTLSESLSIRKHLL